MLPAKRDAPQCHSLQAARDKGMRLNWPVPTGCHEKARLLRCTPWQGMALAGEVRLTSIAFSWQREREISVNTP
jgi:hypothetical protein